MMVSQELEIFQKIFARGIDSCLATRVFTQFQGGIPLQEILQLLPAGRWVEK
jgi:hypothetical protein